MYVAMNSLAVKAESAQRDRERESAEKVSTLYPPLGLRRPCLQVSTEQGVRHKVSRGGRANFSDGLPKVPLQHRRQPVARQEAGRLEAEGGNRGGAGVLAQEAAAGPDAGRRRDRVAVATLVAAAGTVGGDPFRI